MKDRVNFSKQGRELLQDHSKALQMNANMDYQTAFSGPSAVRNDRAVANDPLSLIKQKLNGTRKLESTIKPASMQEDTFNAKRSAVDHDRASSMSTTPTGRNQPVMSPAISPAPPVRRSDASSTGT